MIRPFSLLFSLLFIFILISASFAEVSQINRSQKESKSDTKVIYKYRESESYDFSDMTIEGNLLAPGDLSLQARDKKEFDYNYPVPKSFDKQMLDDLEEIQ